MIWGRVLLVFVFDVFGGYYTFDRVSYIGLDIVQYRLANGCVVLGVHLHLVALRKLFCFL